ncbi:hypothetical protein [Pseudomonas palleroniana]|uniref:hypothetical protein n=1 Tax=Pseudomonas palleroniana TaxID=191390 RepID=UPI001FD43CA0|nr:hypothetical protein [Pseudomonas palleroniana]UOP11281.1 hypothetical protein LDL65_01610 [Pseudomonas palleroniana]
MNLSSMIIGALLVLIFSALMVGLLAPKAQLIRMGGSSWFLVGQNVERTGSFYVVSAS